MYITFLHFKKIKTFGYLLVYIFIQIFSRFSARLFYKYDLEFERKMYRPRSGVRVEISMQQLWHIVALTD